MVCTTTTRYHQIPCELCRLHTSKGDCFVLGVHQLFDLSILFLLSVFCLYMRLAAFIYFSTCFSSSSCYFPFFIPFLGLISHRWFILTLFCTSYRFLDRLFCLHLTVSLALMAALGRSVGKIISISKLGNVAAICVCVCVCPGHSLHFHACASVK